MNQSQKRMLLLAAVAIITLIVLSPAQAVSPNAHPVFAYADHGHDEYVTQEDLSTALTTVNTVNQTIVNEYNDYVTNNSTTSVVFDDSRLKGAIASLAASSNIPDVVDGNTGIGVGFGYYDSTEAMAIGVVHKLKSEPLTIRATVGFTSKEEIYGAGMTFGF